MMMTQDQVNQLAASSTITIAGLRESGATAEQLQVAAKWLTTQPGYHGQPILDKSEAARVIGQGPAVRAIRNTPTREAANMCLIAAGQID
jgi:DNA-binding MurR/RpiR family transcriptional regulator